MTKAMNLINPLSARICSPLYLLRLPDGNATRIPEGESKVRPSSVAFSDSFPLGGSLQVLSKVAFGDGRLPKLPLTKARQEALPDRRRGGYIFLKSVILPPEVSVT